MPIRLALSLHAADEALRSQIMPVNDRYPLLEVLAACDRFYEAKRRMIFIEYVMLKGVNDSYAQAVQLADDARSKKVQDQLDPVQPDRFRYDGSGREAIGAFKAALESNGIERDRPADARPGHRRGLASWPPRRGLGLLSDARADPRRPPSRGPRAGARAPARRSGRAGRDRAVPSRPGQPLKSAGALLVIARERGSPTWVKLQSTSSGSTSAVRTGHAFHTDMEYYEGRADGLLASARDRTPSAAAAFEGERVEMTPQGARVVVAQRHGFASWSALRRHVEGLADGGEPSRGPTGRWRSVDTMILTRCWRSSRSWRRRVGPTAMRLINMASDAETFRVLLDAGADVAHPNAYGWTPLHQAAYGNRGDLAALLLDAGASADVSARGAGGTPLVVALFWGHREVVDVLLAARRHPGQPARRGRDRRRGDDRRDGVWPTASSAKAAGALRGFYRPHCAASPP